MRSFWLSLLLGAGLVLGSAPSHTETVHLPKTGVPAFSVDVPTGWTYDYDQSGNLQFTSGDHSTALQLSMIVDPSVGTTPLSSMATLVFESAGAEPYSKNEPSTLAGHAGEAFYGNLIINNKLLHMEVVLAKLDNSHAACLTTLSRDGATPEQLAALNALIGLIQLSGTQ